MKALLINSQHPETPHIGAVRAARFAAGLALRGHKVTLLTPTLRPEDQPTWSDLSSATLNAHDWGEPLVLTHPMKVTRLQRMKRNGELPGVARRLLTAAALTVGNGTAGDRVAGSRPIWRPLASKFAPDIVWTTFGDTSNLAVAQSIARLSNAPWIMDIKDNWEAFLPRGLRRLVAWRFRDAAGITSNAELHARVAARWHQKRVATIYSGIAPEMIAPRDPISSTDCFRIVLVGSTRGSRHLVPFLADLEHWIAGSQFDERQRIEFCYAGGSTGEVRAAVAEAGLSCRINVQSYLSLSDLGRLCQDAAVNCYLWEPTTFHHKLLELLACKRRVISYPGEHDESVALAHRVGGSLSRCADRRQLAAALEQVRQSCRDDSELTSSIEVAPFSWDAMTAKLESFMLEAIGANQAATELSYLSDRPPAVTLR